MKFGAFDGSGFTLGVARDLNLTQVTLPIYWQFYPNLGERANRAVYLKARGLGVVAHAGIYAKEPDWPDATESTTEQRRRIDDCAYWLEQHCACIDVVNEFIHYPVFGAASLFSWALGQWERRVNEYGLLTGEITDQFVAALTGNAGLYERIGVQCHVECDYDTALVLLPGIKANLDKLAALGKPIDISEMSIPSSKVRFANWTEKRQASYLRKLFAIFKTHSAVESISWWELKDHPTMYNPESGLIRANGGKRAAYSAWKELAK